MLHEAGMLEHFYTDICAVKGWPQFLNLFPNKIRPAGVKRLLGRVPSGVPNNKITAFTNFGWEYHKARGHGGTAVHLAFGKRFCDAVVTKGFGNATATYTFNSAGLELMRAAKNAGLRTIMEQTIAPRAVEADILRQAIEKYPEWAVRGSDPDTPAFIKREEEEWGVADLILCGSRFVAHGIALRGGPVEKCRVVPYGVDTHFQLQRRVRSPGPLRVLTVGQVGLRKGTAVVWDAARLVGAQAEFRMVGGLAVPKGALAKKPLNVELCGTVPRSEIFEHYKWADVFLLPSLCEGSATVTYEAMLAGLPVICTENTGSIVEDGVSGWTVPILAPERTAECICALAEKPKTLDEFSTAAILRSQMATIDAYRARLLDALVGVIE